MNYINNRFSLYIKDMKSGSIAIASLIAIISFSIAILLIMYICYSSIYLKTMGFKNEDRILYTQGLFDDGAGMEASSNPINMTRLAKKNTTQEEMAFFLDWGPQILSSHNNKMLFGGYISANLFNVLSMSRLGESGNFLKNIDDNDLFALITHSAKLNKFPDKIDVIGEKLTINDIEFKIIGVLPEDFTIPFFSGDYRPEIFLPLKYAHEYKDKSPGYFSTNLHVFSLPKDGVSIDDSIKEIKKIAREDFITYQTGWPPEFKFDIKVTAVKEMMKKNDGSSFQSIFIAIFIVFVISVSAITSIQISISKRNFHKNNIKLSLGLSRHGLTKQMFLSNIAIGFIASLIALIIANLLFLLLGNYLYLITTNGSELGVTLNAALVSLGLGILFSIYLTVIDIIFYKKINISQGMRSSGKNNSLGPSILFQTSSFGFLFTFVFIASILSYPLLKVQLAGIFSGSGYDYDNFYSVTYVDKNNSLSGMALYLKIENSKENMVKNSKQIENFSISSNALISSSLSESGLYDMKNNHMYNSRIIFSQADIFEQIGWSHIYLDESFIGWDDENVAVSNKSAWQKFEKDHEFIKSDYFNGKRKVFNYTPDIKYAGNPFMSKNITFIPFTKSAIEKMSTFTMNIKTDGTEIREKDVVIDGLIITAFSDYNAITGRFSNGFKLNAFIIFFVLFVASLSSSVGINGLIRFSFLTMKKDLGVYKSIGETNNRLVLRALESLFNGIIISVVLSLIFIIFSMLYASSSVIGMLNFGNTIAAISFSIAVTIFAVLSIYNTISKSSTKELLEL